MTDVDYIARLLEAERAALPPSGTAQAGARRLFEALATSAAPLPVATGALGHGGWPLIVKWIGLGFVIGTAGAGVASYAASAPEPPALEQPVHVAAPSAAVVRVNQHPEGVPVVSATRGSVLPAPNSLRPVSPSRASSTLTPAAKAPAFDEELRLITSAKRELDARRAHLAVVWLEEHRQRFARGVFSVEREGLLVLAACETRRKPQLARAFATQHPSSPMLGQLLRRCGADAVPSTPSSASRDFVEGNK